MFTGQMAMKSLGLAAIALGCSLSVAVAAPPPGPGPTPDQRALLKAAVAEHIGVAQTPGGAAVTGSKNRNAATLTSGWNYAHASYCGWYVDSSGGQWFYIYPVEGGIIYTINNLYTSQGLQVPCGEGYYIGWYVTNPSTGAYSQTESYTYK
jgi:hypothetical protein